MSMVKKEKAQPPKTQVGLKSGKLIVVDPGPYFDEFANNRLAKRMVMVRCDCGAPDFYTREINIIRGLSTRCVACRNREHGAKLRNADGGWTHWHNRYRQNARNRARFIDFGLTVDEVKQLCSQPCYYCDEPPALRRMPRNHIIYASGIDRKNPNQGYDKDNIVPCCSRCNSSKWNMTEEEFISHIKKIYKKVRD